MSRVVVTGKGVGKGHLIISQEVKDKLDVIKLSIPDYRVMKKEDFYNMVIEEWVLICNRKYN